MGVLILKDRSEKPNWTISSFFYAWNSLRKASNASLALSFEIRQVTEDMEVEMVSILIPALERALNIFPAMPGVCTS